MHKTSIDRFFSESVDTAFIKLIFTKINNVNGDEG